jgi:hypothetical protein
MKIDLEAVFQNGLVNNASDVDRLSFDSTANSTGIVFFDKDKKIYIANDFEDKQAITISLQDFTDLIKNEIVVDVMQLMLDKLDSAFATNAVQGAPLDPLWATKSAEIQVEIDDAKDKLDQQKQDFAEIENNLK